MKLPKVRMREIHKSFYGLKANDGVSLSAGAGTIHGLLGENGAGKTTLMNILAGIYRADSGEIFINGRRVSIRSPKDAVRSGIGMVHQHFRLIRPFTVAENLAICQPHAGFFLRRCVMEEKVARLMDRYGFRVSPSAKISELSVGEAQKVEIAKALFRGAEILILDEPTAVLTPGETEDFFLLLKEMCRQGLTIFFITHKLAEVLRFAEDITVMRQGESVAALKASDTDVNTLAELMIGKGAAETPSGLKLKTPKRSKEPVLALERVSTVTEGSTCALRNVALKAYAGEIAGVAGVSGNGQQSLADVLIGIRKVASGNIKLGSRDMTGRDVRSFIRRGVAYIPGDRLGEGLCPGLSVCDNTILKRHAEMPFAKRGMLNRSAITRKASDIIEEYALKTPDVNFPVRFLSGGNLQRLLIGREFDPGVRLLVAMNPTRGLDIEGIRLVHEKFLEQRERGAALVLISEDLDELKVLSDRLYVIYMGKLSRPFERAAQEQGLIGRLMGGVGFSEEGA